LRFRSTEEAAFEPGKEVLVIRTVALLLALAVAQAALAQVFVWPPTHDTVMGLRDVTRALLAESLDNVLPKLLAQKSADEE
jgi:hypothetical protein